MPQTSRWPGNRNCWQDLMRGLGGLCIQECYTSHTTEIKTSVSLQPTVDYTHTSDSTSAVPTLAMWMNLHPSFDNEGRWGTTDDFTLPQMTSQPVSSIFLCFQLPSGTWRTPGLSIPWCCLPISSSVCLVFSPLSLCLARWFWPDPMNRRYVHSLHLFMMVRRSLCGTIACWILA